MQEISKVPSTGAWSIALREGMSDAVVAQMSPHDSPEGKLEALEGLAQKLESLREYDRWDRLQNGPVVPKRNYHVVDQIDTGSYVRCLQVLPGDTMVTTHAGSIDEPAGGLRILRSISQVRVWTWNEHGTWTRDNFAASSGVEPLHVLPDSWIVLGDTEEVFVSRKDESGAWRSESIGKTGGWISAVQALPEGRIVTAGSPEDLCVWTKDDDTTWNGEVLRGHSGEVHCFQALSDGTIVSGSHDKTIRVWSKVRHGEWEHVVIEVVKWPINSLHVVDGDTIVAGTHRGGVYVCQRPRGGGWSSERVGEQAGRICSIQALSDGRIVSASFDGTIQIATKKMVGGNLLTTLSPWRTLKAEWSCEILQANDESVTGIQVLPDGRIVSGGSDGIIRVWDGEEIAGGLS